MKCLGQGLIFAGTVFVIAAFISDPGVFLMAQAIPNSLPRQLMVLATGLGMLISGSVLWAGARFVGGSGGKAVGVDRVDWTLVIFMLVIMIMSVASPAGQMGG